VVISATLDEEGNVYDAQVLSGPKELRAAAMESVLKWHYAGVGNGTDRVAIVLRFELAPQNTPPSVPVPQNYDRPIGLLVEIEAPGLRENDRETLFNRLPLRVGDEVTPRLISEARTIVQEFDEHLRMGMRKNPVIDRVEEAETKLTLLISYPGGTVDEHTNPQGIPKRIRVGESVQAQRLVESAPPDYPSLARDEHLVGTVRLAVTIGEDGRVKQTEIISGHTYFIAAAVEAVRQWQYKPMNRPEQQNQQADVGHDKSGLPTLPWKTRCRRCEYVHAQQSQQADKPRTLVDVPAGVVPALARLDDRGPSQYDGERSQQEDGQPERSQESQRGSERRQGHG
jgi:TonB family protein